MVELTPKEYLSLLDFCAALTAQRPTAKEIMSFNYAPVSIDPMFLPKAGKCLSAYHVKGICHQCQRSDRDSHAQLQAEEAGVDHQHDDNACRLRHAHLGGCGELALRFDSGTVVPLRGALLSNDVVWRACYQAAIKLAHTDW